MGDGNGNGGMANVMIVDDTPHHLRLLARMLQDQGYTVRPFPRGRLAIDAAVADPPELILLDINMPEMDGFEVCRRIKGSDLLCNIPVLFLSASGETGDKVEAFNAGGVDYITKPYQLEEVTARVETHLRLARLQCELEHHNRHLEELVLERTRQLAEARDQLAILDKAKSDFLQLISHQLRTPLNGVLGVGNILLDKCAHVAAAARLRNAFRAAQHELLAIVDDSLLLTEINISDQPLTSEELSIGTIVAEAASEVSELAEARGVDLGIPPISPALVRGDCSLLVRAFSSLLETAVKLSARSESLHWHLAAGEECISVAIDTHGRSIPEEVLPRFFQVLAIAEPLSPGGDLGLKPVLAERIVSLFGGTVAVATLGTGLGASFTVTLPLARIGRQRHT